MRCSTAPERVDDPSRGVELVGVALAVAEAHGVHGEAFVTAMARHVAESSPPESRTTAAGRGEADTQQTVRPDRASPPSTRDPLTPPLPADVS